MATLDISPSFRSAAVGVDRLLDPWRSAMRLDSSEYPPYDILKTAEDQYRISLALAGWTREDITVETRESSLWVKGERKVDPHHNQYLFKGIGFDGFERSFRLPEHVRVQAARLEHGILHIDLVRELPEEMRPRRIEITSDANSRQMLDEKAA